MKNEPDQEKFAHLKIYSIQYILFFVCILPFISEGQPIVTPVTSFHQKFGRSSSPFYLFNAGRLTFFAASDPLHGRELWLTDGTEKGTHIVKDISLSGGSYPQNFVELNHLIYFVAGNEKYGRELWVTDGTASGTRLLKDIEPGPEDSGLCCLTRVGNRIFFRTELGLWRTDGTDTGTVFIKDVHVTDERLAVRDIFYFVSYTEDAGAELWRSDGTPCGTRIVKDIRPGFKSSSPENLVESNGLLYFSADNGIHGEELWVSNGTVGGTRMVKDIRKGKRGSFPSKSKPMNGILYFSADDGKHGQELWRSDGTLQGTQLLKDIWPLKPSTSPQRFFVFRSILYFSANIEFSGEFWRSDGTQQGTYGVKKVWPSNFQESNGTLFFVGSDGKTTSIWKTDGTSSGTVSSDVPINPSTDLVNGGGFLLFANYDSATGYELWRTDDLQIRQVKDIWKGLQDVTPQWLTAHKGQLYFSAFREDVGYELWKTNGTPDGTALVADLFPGPGSSGPNHLISSGKYLYFYALDTGRSERFFRTDGTSEGTIKLSNIIVETGYYAVPFKENLVFLTYDPIAIWRSNGTPDGTVMLKEFEDIYGPLVEANGLMFFQANDSVHGLELWKTDGTVSGTRIVKDIQRGRRSSLNYSDSLMFTFDGKTLFFTLLGIPGENNLWRTDGTPESTQFVEPFPVNTHSATVVGDSLFFVAGSKHGYVLWKTSGKPGSTREVIDGLPPSNDLGPNPSSLTRIHNKLYFSQQTQNEGRELWVSDGTSGGTFIVKDIAPGEGSSGARNMYAFGNLVLFTATDRKNGPELWITDGTEDGTYMVADLLPGGLGSNPNDFTKAGNFLFFIARSTTSRKQIWMLQLNSKLVAFTGLWSGMSTLIP